MLDALAEPEALGNDVDEAEAEMAALPERPFEAVAPSLGPAVAVGCDTVAKAESLLLCVGASPENEGARVPLALEEELVATEAVLDCERVAEVEAESWCVGDARGAVGEGREEPVPPPSNEALMEAVAKPVAEPLMLAGSEAKGEEVGAEGVGRAEIAALCEAFTDAVAEPVVDCEAEAEALLHADAESVEQPIEAVAGAEEQPDEECDTEVQNESVLQAVTDPAKPLPLAAALAHADAEPASPEAETVGLLLSVVLLVPVSISEAVLRPLPEGLRVAPPFRLLEGCMLAQEVPVGAESVGSRDAEDREVGVAAAAVALRNKLAV